MGFIIIWAVLVGVVPHITEGDDGAEMSWLVRECYTYRSTAGKEKTYCRELPWPGLFIEEDN